MCKFAAGFDRVFRMMAGSDFTGTRAGMLGKAGMDLHSVKIEGSIPTGRLNMQQMRDLLRLKPGQGLSERHGSDKERWPQPSERVDFLRHVGVMLQAQRWHDTTIAPEPYCGIEGVMGIRKRSEGLFCRRLTDCCVTHKTVSGGFGAAPAMSPHANGGAGWRATMRAAPLLA